MSVQQLSDAVERLGVTIQRPVLSNLENGRRETITLPELDVLAAALGVPRLLLEYPVGRIDVVEPLPGIEVSPWAAVNWVEHGRLPGLAEPDFENGASVIMEYRRHDELEQMWEQARREARHYRELLEKPAEWLQENDLHPAELRAELARREQTEERARFLLKQLRAMLDQRGVILPPLSPALATALGDQHEDVAP